MSPLSKIAISAAFFATSVLAAPTTQDSATTPPPWKECPAGTWWNQCGSGSNRIEGCFDHDPCVAPSGPKAPVEKACPTNTSEPGLKVLPSTYWAVSPNFPDQGYEATDYFYLLNDTASNEVYQQVLVFKDIDASRAKTCKINWYMDLKEETVFEVEGDGYVRFTHLLDFPVDTVSPTFNFLNQFESEDAMNSMPSMGGWDDKSQHLGHKQDSATEFPCSETFAFIAKLDKINQNGGMVYMEPSKTIGVSVDYWC